VSTRALRIGTRASELALWQARHVEALLRAQPGAPPVELVHIRTSGDTQAEVPLWKVGGRAFFTREIDHALVSEAVDIAVHSLKDLPTTLEAGLTLAAMLPRADPRDALLSRDGAKFAQLPRGARIGTSSLRRRAFLKRLRPDVVLVELRGNVPTRIAKLKQGTSPSTSVLRTFRRRCRRVSSVSVPARPTRRRCAGWRHWITRERAWRRVPSARC
jgi:hydroxymethylbilane synthase